MLGTLSQHRVGVNLNKQRGPWQWLQCSDSTAKFQVLDFQGNRLALPTVLPPSPECGAYLYPSTSCCGKLSLELLLQDQGN